MKRIKAACLLQPVCFQVKDEYPSEYNRQQVQHEYESYKNHMTKNGTKFKIPEETTLDDG